MRPQKKAIAVIKSDKNLLIYYHTEPLLTAFIVRFDLNDLILSQSYDRLSKCVWITISPLYDFGETLAYLEECANTFNSENHSF